MNDDESSRMTFADKMAIAEMVVAVPAMTLIINTRKDVGARLARRQTVMSGIVIMLIIGWIVEWSQPQPQPFLFLFGVVTLFQYLFHLFHRWRAFKRGDMPHSYYLGTSGFEFRWMPRFIRRSRFMARFFDPLVFGLIGFGIVNYTPPLGFWLILASACLLVLEQLAWSREIHRQYDVSDGLVSSEVQGETVDRFAPPTQQPGQPAPGSTAIPTGLGSDIAHQVKRRRNRRPPMESAPQTASQVFVPKRKSPSLATGLGLVSGGFGLGIYFRSWIDFLFPMLIWAGVGYAASIRDQRLALIAPAGSALYGYLRARAFNWRVGRSRTATNRSTTNPDESSATVAAKTEEAAASSAEQRLVRLHHLLQKNLISKDEYEAKRQQILSEL